MGTNWSDEGNSLQEVHHAHHPDHSLHPTPNHKYTAHSDSYDRIKPFKAKLPHNCESILKHSDSPINQTSFEKFYEQLQAGIFLNGRRKKYWVKENINCFMVFANDLAITWAENPRHWYLHSEETREHGRVTVAQLRNITWLEVHGRFHTANLSPGVTYNLTYVIMLENTAYGWDRPVNFRLSLPSGKKQEHKVNFNDKPRGKWIRVLVGELKTTSENIGEIKFSLYEHEGGSWKKGLVIQGVTIEPKS